MTHLLPGSQLALPLLELGLVLLLQLAHLLCLVLQQHLTLLALCDVSACVCGVTQSRTAHNAILLLFTCFVFPLAMHINL